MKSLTQYNLKSRPEARHGVCPGARRGNTMVLVAGILVLLVIIATAFITRSQTSRLTAASQLAASKRTDTSHAIADSMAQIISEALFVRKIINYGLPPNEANDANLPRRMLDPNAVRYSFDFNGSGGNDDYPYNFAPYSVVPFTNWPDAGSIISGSAIPNANLPFGPGNVGGGSPILASEGNPIGNPGFGDTRWLRDIEPLRFDSPIPFPVDGQLDTFFHWRHLTNIAHANNGYRIVMDIADVFNTADDPTDDLHGGLLLELNIPVEQWLADPLPNASLTDFFLVWNDWFSANYFNNYIDSTGESIPPNFYQLGAFGSPADEFDFSSDRNIISRVLADADGDGFTDSFWFLTPTSPDSGIRQIVAVSITDNSARLNANVATAFDRTSTTGATPSDLALIGDRLWNDNVPDTSPLFINNFERVGFFDNFRNEENYYLNNPAINLYGGTSTVYDIFMWASKDNSSNPPFTVPENFLGSLGVLLPDGISAGSPNPNFPSFTIPILTLANNPVAPLSVFEDRLFYWQNAGSRPFDAKQDLTPFGTDSELELRMFEGQNYPWIVSSFENSVQDNVSSQTGFQLLHGNLAREESSEYLDQLDARELLFDARRKLTLFSGARNDLMPPWLWWRWDEIPPEHVDFNFPPNGIADGDPFDPTSEAFAFINFRSQSREKLDLRERDLFGPDGIPGNADDKFLLSGELSFDNRLAQTLLLALSDPDPAVGGVFSQGGDSYLGPYAHTGLLELEKREELRKLAASYAANIKAYRDSDSDAFLADAEKVPQMVIPPVGSVGIEELSGVDATTVHRFLGFEKQPFLLEAFIAHAYEVFTVPAGYLNTGQKIVLETDDSGVSLQSTVVCVQIANPFSEPISLIDPNFEYELELFGQTISLRDVAIATGRTTLPPASDNQPATMILYSIDETLVSAGNFRTQWIDFLDIDITDHPGDGVTDDSVILVNLQDPAILAAIGTGWSRDRATYDSISSDVPALQLVRVEDPLGALGAPARVVIDRIEEPAGSLSDASDRYRDTVWSFGDNNNSPPKYVDLVPPVPLANAIPPSLFPTNGWAANHAPSTHWAQWARVTRAWANDPGLVTSNNRRYPRFITADQEYTYSSEEVPNNDPRADYLVERIFEGGGNRAGVSFILSFDPDDEPADSNMPWFTAEYTDAALTPDLLRKPTFFDMNYAGDPLFPLQGYADKGYYHSPISLQMLQKDANFDQVGEVLNVWVHTHELRMLETAPGSDIFLLDEIGINEDGNRDGGTVRTFSEYLMDDDHIKLRTGRLRVRPEATDLNPVIGVGLATNQSDIRHMVPNLPASARVLDVFVCDDIGLVEDYNNNGVIDVADRATHVFFDRSYRNAGGFAGKSTPGLININTATVEVMRALPQMDRLVHNDPLNVVPWNVEPYVAVPQAIVHYRERFSGIQTGYPGGAPYTFREPNVRGERGIASIGELMLLDQEALATNSPPAAPILRQDWRSKVSWQIDFAAQNPFTSLVEAGAHLSTDVQGPITLDGLAGDEIAEDVEEANLLFAGISNLITTRSDMFTVHFIIRSFRQNPITGVWDATDREQIVDERRYVMLVDRSEVNQPTDRPRILYLEKLPN